jgi:flagellar protein FlaJ
VSVALPPALRQAEKRLTEFEMIFFGKNLPATLRSAHLPVTADEYMRTVHFNIAVTFTALLMIRLFFFLTGYEINTFGIETTGLLLWIVLFLLMVPGQYLMHMYYPEIVARGRKSRIDLDLPYAISYMQALSTTMTPYEIIRQVFLEQDMFGEISNEFGMIIRDVELFGDDLNTAMKNLQCITPSSNLRDFINDLAIVFDSGGNVTTYLAAKTEYYRDRAKQELELVLKTMEIMAEVYVTAFVAGPISLIIMVVAQGMANVTSMEWMLPVLYIGIPVGAIVLIWILSLMMPPENLEISRKETFELGFGSDVPGSDPPGTGDNPADQEFYQRVEMNKRWNFYFGLLRHPIRTYIRSYWFGIALGGFFAGIVALAWLIGIFNTVFSHDIPEAVFCVVIVAFMAPVALAYEGRRWYVQNIESHLPDFLRELSDMKDIGITLHEAIHRISHAKLGVLSSELSVASRDIESGVYVSSALVKMEERIGLVSVKRAISLLVRASEITTNLRQIFIIAITDFEYYLKLKRERANTAIVYVMIIYLSVGIYLYTAYQLNIPFLAAFKEMNVTMNTAGNLTVMFHVGIILSIFSGIMAGQFSSNSILAGFKHSIVLITATLILFVMMM